MRPTWGLISRSGIIPVSYTQDTIGPIARCVEDIALALSVMASVGYDKSDNATAAAPSVARGKDYTAALSTGSLPGVRVGMIEGFFNRTESSETTPVNEAMANITAKLRAAGATIVPITESIYNATAISSELDVQRFEFRQEMNAYLERPSLGSQHPDTLNELYAGHDFLVVPSEYEYVTTALVSSTSNATYAATKLGIQDLTLALQRTFASNDVDAIIYPEQMNLVVPIGAPSQSGRNGILAALTGSPVVVVPIGFSPATTTAPGGVPIGMEILGPKWAEEKLLQIAFQVERLGTVRQIPSWAKQVVEVVEYENVPDVTPNRSNIPAAYPVGVL
jgi:Asp-tRNA(Asn)/Glu-tRNA(Gln) amidotransferase A subunit family amidase